MVYPASYLITARLELHEVHDVQVRRDIEQGHLVLWTRDGEWVVVARVAIGLQLDQVGCPFFYFPSYHIAEGTTVGLVIARTITVDGSCLGCSVVAESCIAACCLSPWEGVSEGSCIFKADDRCLDGEGVWAQVELDCLFLACVGVFEIKVGVEYGLLMLVWCKGGFFRGDARGHFDYHDNWAHIAGCGGSHL